MPRWTAGVRQSLAQAIFVYVLLPKSVFRFGAASAVDEETWSIGKLLTASSASREEGSSWTGRVKGATYSLGYENASVAPGVALPKPARVMVPSLAHFPAVTRVREGVVVYASGNKARYARGATVLVETLRAPDGAHEMKPLSDLPIEVFYGCEDEAFPERLRQRLEQAKGVAVRSLSAALFTTLRDHPDATYMAGNEACRYLPAYGRKVLASMLSSFERLVLFDADVIPLVDPATLFELPEFRRSGMVLFGDYVPLGTFFNDHARLLAFLGLDPLAYQRVFSGQEADSSCVVIDKGFIAHRPPSPEKQRRHRWCDGGAPCDDDDATAGTASFSVVWDSLHLALAMNAMSASYYRAPPPPEPASSGFVFGDKDTWALAAIIAEVPLAPPPSPPAAVAVAPAAVDLAEMQAVPGKAPKLLLEHYQRADLLHVWDRFNPLSSDFRRQITTGSADHDCAYQLLEGHLQQAILPGSDKPIPTPLFLNAQSSLFGVLTYFQNPGGQKDSIYIRSFRDGSEPALHYSLCDSRDYPEKNDGVRILTPDVLRQMRAAAERYTVLVDYRDDPNSEAAHIVSMEHDFQAKPSLGLIIGVKHSGLVEVTGLTPNSDPRVKIGMVLLSVAGESCIGRGLDFALSLLRSQREAASNVAAAETSSDGEISVGNSKSARAELLFAKWNSPWREW